MPRAHGAIMKAARADHQALNGETLYRAGERMAASRLGADVDGTATSPGRNDTNRVPRAEIVAISTSSVVDRWPTMAGSLYATPTLDDAPRQSSTIEY